MTTTVKRWKQKDPNDIADYWFEWDSFIDVEEIISDHEVTVPAGLTLLAASHTDKFVRLRLSGGTAGSDYPITCLITTDNGQEFEATKTLKVRERTDVSA